MKRKAINITLAAVAIVSASCESAKLGKLELHGPFSRDENTGAISAGVIWTPPRKAEPPLPEVIDYTDSKAPVDVDASLEGWSVEVPGDLAAAE